MRRLHHHGQTHSILSFRSLAAALRPQLPTFSAVNAVWTSQGN
jgi:hypothetical protein